MYALLVSWPQATHFNGPARITVVPSFEPSSSVGPIQFDFLMLFFFEVGTVIDFYSVQKKSAHRKAYSLPIHANLNAWFWRNRRFGRDVEAPTIRHCCEPTFATWFDSKNVFIFKLRVISWIGHHSS